MGIGEEPNHTTAIKPGQLYIIQYFLLCEQKGSRLLAPCPGLNVQCDTAMDPRY